MSFPGGTFPQLTGSSLAAPSSTAFSPFNGFSSGASPAASSLSVGPVATTPLEYKGHNIQANDSEALPIATQYISAHSSISELRADTLINSITYGASPKDIQYWKSQGMRQNMKDDAMYFGPPHLRDGPDQPKYDREKEGVKFMTLSRLLRYLKSKEGRNTFGTMKDFKDVRKVWKFMGIDGTEIAQNFGENDAMVKRIIAGKRARIKDITALHKTPIQMNQRLYLVWVLKEYDESSLSELAKKSGLQDDDSLQSAPYAPVPMDIDGKDSKYPSASIQSADAKAAVDAKADASSTAKEYYWEAIPWICERGREPPREIYVTDSFTGGTEYIGWCKDRYGDSTSAMNQAKARMFLYPETDTDKWKREGVDLPEIEIFVLVG